MSEACWIVLEIESFLENCQRLPFENISIKKKELRRTKNKLHMCRAVLTIQGPFLGAKHSAGFASLKKNDIQLPS